MLKKCAALWTTLPGQSTALLTVRLIAGLGMFLHGIAKSGAPSSWAGEALPGLVQFAVVAFEIGVPLFWFVGFLTPFVSLALGGTMMGAIVWHMRAGDGFTTRPGYELAVMYLLICIVFLFLGPGKFSLDYLWLKKPRS